MLALEDQVCSVKLSKRLEELGIPKGSLFYWFEPKDLITNHNYILMYQKELLMEDFHQSVSAFTVAELVEMLPAFIHLDESKAPFNNFNLYINKRTYKNIQFIVNYECDTTQITKECNEHSVFFPKLVKNIFSEKLSDALAGMLIHLLENKLITVEEINKCHG